MAEEEDGDVDRGNLPDPAGAYAPSPGGPVDASPEPGHQEMPPARNISGSTPGRGGNLQLQPVEFFERCEKCIGVFLAKRVKVHDDDDGSSSSSGSSTSHSSDESETEVAMNNNARDSYDRDRSLCHICHRQTDYECQGCGRTLCIKPPRKEDLEKVLAKQSKLLGSNKRARRSTGSTTKKSSSNKGKAGRKKKKKSRKSSRKSKKDSSAPLMVPRIKKEYPTTFCIEVPQVQVSNGEVVTDRDGYPIYVKKYGEYSCYHIAHHEAWKKHLHASNSSVIEQLTLASHRLSLGPSESNNSGRKRRGRKR